MVKRERVATTVYIPAEIADEIRAFLREVWGEEDVGDMITYLVWQAVRYALKKEDFKEFYVKRALRGDDLDLLLRSP